MNRVKKFAWSGTRSLASAQSRRCKGISIALLPVYDERNWHSMVMISEHGGIHITYAYRRISIMHVEIDEAWIRG